MSALWIICEITLNLAFYSQVRYYRIILKEGILPSLGEAVSRVVGVRVESDEEQSTRRRELSTQAAKIAGDQERSFKDRLEASLTEVSLTAHGLPKRVEIEVFSRKRITIFPGNPRTINNPVTILLVGDNLTLRDVGTILETTPPNDSQEFVDRLSRIRSMWSSRSKK